MVLALSDVGTEQERGDDARSLQVGALVIADDVGGSAWAKRGQKY
jgi:hypothetical protein